MKVPLKRFSAFDQVLQEAWQSMWQRPAAFFPLIYLYLGAIVVIGVLFLGLVAQLGWDSLINLETLVASIGHFLVAVIVAMMVLIVLAIHSSALKVAIFGAIGARKRMTLGQAFSVGKQFFWRVFGLVILAGLIILLPILVSIGFVSIGDVLDGLGRIAFMVLGGMGFHAAIAWVIIASAWLLFLMPVLAYERLSIGGVLGRCWQMLWEDARFVWLSLLISVGISLAVALTLFILRMAIGFGEVEPWWFVIVRIVTNAVMSVWLGLFLFRAYAMRYKPKGL